MKRIVVTGANGNMGRFVVKMISEQDDFKLVGAVDIDNVGQDINQILGINDEEMIIAEDLLKVIEERKVDLIVDFTTPEVVLDNIRLAIDKGIDMVVGTTGLSEVEIDEIRSLNNKKNRIIIAPNFAVGAVLMMQFAKKAVRFMDDVEIIELHHDRKLESPSGTAVKTAELLAENFSVNQVKENGFESIDGACGASFQGINIHSIRLPGLVSHQEVIFGGVGQTLSIRFDSISRESFMPGLAMAIRAIDEVEGVVYGFENLINL